MNTTPKPRNIPGATIPFKSQLRAIRNLEKRNEAFYKLSEEEKRKEIAYDAYMLMYSGVIKPSDGCYWNHQLREKTQNFETSKELQDFLVKLKPNSLGKGRYGRNITCEVCQRGGMMMSIIRLGNNIEPSTYGLEEGTDEILENRGFDHSTFKKMEEVYEYNEEYLMPYQDNTREMFLNICCNVIANGDFNTDDRTDYLTKPKK